MELPFNVTMAAIDPTAETGAIGERTSVIVRVEEDEYILCNLITGKVEQQMMNRTFTPGATIKFMTNGKASVHLTGSFLTLDHEFDEGYGETLGATDSESEDIEDEDFDSEMDDFIVATSDEEDEEDEAHEHTCSECSEDDAAVPAKKSPKIKELSDSAASDAAVDSDEEIDSDMELLETAGETSDEQEDDEDEDDEDSELDDSDFDSEAFSEDEDDDEEDDEEEEDEEEEEKAEEKAVEPVLKENDKKRAQPAAPQGVKKPKLDTPASTPQKKDAAPAKTAVAPSAATTKTVNGVKIEELAPGKPNGPIVKNGSKVGILYTGKLPNGKVFDSNMKAGKPLKFKVGAGDVIKGFDIGVSGMALNASRRVTIPPALGYGQKGVPGIPPNSTLIFDIKLVNLN